MLAVFVKEAYYSYKSAMLQGVAATALGNSLSISRLNNKKETDMYYITTI